MGGVRAPPAQRPAENLPRVSKLHCPSSRGDGPEVPRNCTNQYSLIVCATAVTPMGREGVGGTGSVVHGLSGESWGEGDRQKSLLEGERDPLEHLPMSRASARMGWELCILSLGS